MDNFLQFYSDSFETYRCLGPVLKMCILFGHSPQIIFVTFFTKRTFQSEEILGILCMFLLL